MRSFVACALTALLKSGFAEAIELHQFVTSLMPLQAFALLLIGAAGFAATPLTTVYTFSDTVDTTPFIQATDGNLYGIGVLGGSTTFCGQGLNQGLCSGLIYKLTPQGAYTPLFGFPLLDATNGSMLEDFNLFRTSALVEGPDGALYGTTPSGGLGVRGAGGTFFRIIKDGQFRKLYDFCAGVTFCDDGYEPFMLRRGPDGNFYGRTRSGGRPSADGRCSCGTIFRMSPSGALTSLYSFTFSDPSGSGDMILASDGNFYGYSQKSIFRFSPNGTYTTLYTFNPATDRGPLGPMIQANDGNLYGYVGDANSDQSIFKLTLNGVFTKIRTLAANIEGRSPTGLIQASDGNLWGTTSLGLPDGGAIFSVGLSGTPIQATRASTACTSSRTATAGYLLQAANSTIYAAAGCANTLKIISTNPIAPIPFIAPNGVVSAANFQPGLATNMWVTIKGTNLAAQTGDWTGAVINGRLPTLLNGVSVSMNGKPAYIYYTSPTQLNVLSPPDLTPGPVAVTVTTIAGTSAVFDTAVTSTAPAFFTWNEQPVATHLDYSLAAKPGTFSGLPTIAARPGEAIVLWATGLGGTTPATPAGLAVPGDKLYSPLTPKITINLTIDVPVLGAALAPGTAGLFQVAVQIPSSLADGEWPIQISVGGRQSLAGVLLSVKR
jgi:uncharacterized protein (TIGR03437 family)